VDRKFNDYAVSEIIGTNLLILITVLMFSLLLTTVFTVIEPDVESPTVDILCQVDEDNIILSHVGGESLSTQVKIILNIGTGSNQEYLVDDYLKDELKENGWGFGESLVLTSNQIVVNDITVNLFDEESNSIIFSAILPSPNPLITFVNSINPYLQSISPLEIAATSTGSSPDNVSLWFKWEGYWEDNFENNDIYVLDYNNMSFIYGDYVLVNNSGLGVNIEDYVDNDVGDVDGSSDKGSHSDFNNQKFLDGSYDTLTEENIGGGGTTMTLIDDDFEGANNWNTDWDIVTTYSVSPTHSIECDQDENDLISTDLNTAGASNITISFKYRIDDIGSYDDVYVQYYDGSSYDSIEEIGDDQEDTWLTYSDTISNSGGNTQYFINDFRIKIEGSGIDSGEHLWVDDVLIQKEIIVENYELDLEAQWTNIDYDETYEELCIYAGTMGDEDIIVDAWNGVSWETVFSDLSSGWNNASITTWLTSSTFTIRYKGGTETSDTNQDTWQIDVTLIHIWNQASNSFYEGNITSIDIVKPANKNWSYFNANVNNTANSTFKILDDNNNVLLSDLDGLNNNISIISSDTIRLHGSFNGPVKLNSWNVKHGSQNWLEHNKDTNSSDGWVWSFNFDNGTGLYKFYSIGGRNGWPDEASPVSPDYDAVCYYKT